MSASGGIGRRLFGAAAIAAALAGLLTACSTGESGDGVTTGDDPSGPATSQGPDETTPSSEESATTDGSEDGSTGASGSSTNPDDASEDGVQNPDGAFVEDPDAYDDEPAPPASEAQVLCNLSATYLSGLAAQAGDDDSSTIALVVVSLDDNIQVWGPLVGFYPEMQPDLDRAERVLDFWYDAMTNLDDGDTAAAGEALESANSVIEQVVGPSAELGDELGCAA